MSKIVAFRERIISTIKDSVEDIRDVEWYDGMFDDEDIKEWVLKTPAARVAVMNVPTEHHSTMEMNCRLRVVVVVIDENRRNDHDADGRAWDLVEKIAILANLNKFGDPNAAPATKVKFQRLSQPVLRREGVSIGIVEWESDLMIGRNRVLERDFVYHQGVMVTQTPQSKVIGRANVHNAAGQSANDQADVTPEEE